MGKKTYTMPWKGLKFGAGDDIETRKGPALDTVQQPRRSEHVPRQLTSFLPRLSESTANIPKEGNSNGAPDHHCQEQNKKRSRFNLMRLRHASDPQLSTSYKNAEQSSVPPVPPRKSVSCYKWAMRCSWILFACILTRSLSSPQDHYHRTYLLKCYSRDINQQTQEHIRVFF